jgi:endonuclease/exonuclease/phosphatase family metal-dependent hydrolase
MKLISLNIEGHRHLHERVIPFLIEQQPDVVCLQEVFGVDMPHLKHALQADGLFVPMSNVTEVSKHQSHALGELGLAIFSKHPDAQYDFAYYVTKPIQEGSSLPIFFHNQDANSMHRALAWVTIPHDHSGHSSTIATTHFTWSPQGSYTPEQANDLKALLTIAAQLPPHIVCGDFNSPRRQKAQDDHYSQQNVFAQLAAIYTDNIPQEISTSLDEQWHKAGKLEFMVDGLFSTPGIFELHNTHLVGGVSDHKAVVTTMMLTK